MKSRHVPAVVLIAVAALLVSGAGAGAETVAVQKVEAGPNTRPVKVDPLLLQQLAKSKTGSAPAVITTWNRQQLRAIKRLGITGASLRALPMILTKNLTRAQLAKLRRSPYVRSVWANTKYRVAMEDSTWITRARYAWEKANSNNGLPGLDTTGKGIHIAVIDTGVDAAHEDLENVVEYCDATPITAANPTRTGIHCTPWIAATGNQTYLSGTNPQVDCQAPPLPTCDDN